MATFNVAVYLYPQADILDFSGPTEVYSAPSPDGLCPFKVVSFAHHNPVPAAAQGTLTYIPNATFAEVEQKIEEFDILIIPGAAIETCEELIKSKEGRELSALLRKFAGLEPRKETGKRILQTVCSGALLLAASGILAGRDATTHHTCFDMLKQIADEAAGGDSKINVLKTRWVDGGLTDAGVRIVNAGGVSSGIDASLYIVEHIAGKDTADAAADLIEFDRRTKGHNE